MILRRIIFYTLSCLSLLAAIPISAQTEIESGTHIVESGENLFRIALRYGLTMDELAAANGITDPTRIFAGQTLEIPGLSSADAGDEITNPLIATAPILHTVQRGEYLGSIASLYDVTPDQIIQANNLVNPDRIEVGQQLQIWAPEVSAVSESDLAELLSEETSSGVTEVTDTADLAAASVDPNLSAEAEAAPVETITHTVQAGEHLSNIARRYGITWTSIAEANGITDPNRIFTGMQLIIPNGDPSAAQGIILDEIRSISEDIEPPGAHWGVGRELVVDLSTQMAYAYEDGELKHSALVSTGLPATPTVRGEYAIWHKTRAQTMSGPGYWLPNVEWVMYFYQGYGFHGTYWHNNFGQPMSHGCVNMTNADAQWFYNFADIGTNVWVQL